MKAGRLLGSLLAFCSMLAGQAVSPSSAEGRVVNSVTGAAVRSALVTLQRTTGRAVRPGEPPQTTMSPSDAETDEQGRFAFRNLEAGGYRITAQRQGFVSRNFTGGEPGDTQLWLGEDQQLTGYTVRLTPQSVIAGKVLDEYGDPAIGVPVYAQRAGSSSGAGQQPVVSGQSNDLGEYRIANLSAGDYLVAAVPRNSNFVNASATPRFVYVTTYHAGTTVRGEAAPVRVAEGAEVGGIDVKLTRVKAVNIRGAIVDPGAPPDTRAYPSLRTRTTSGLPGFQLGASPAQDGSFLFAAVPPGSYDLVAQRNSPGTGTLTAIVVLPIEARDKDLDGIVLQLKPSSDLQGTMKVEQPGQCDPRNMMVSFTPAGGTNYSQFVQARVDDDLKFTLKNVPAAVYSISIMGGPAGRCYAKSILYGGREAPAAALEVNESRPVEITLAFSAATLNVVVLDREGKPLPRAGVALVSKDGGGPEMVSIVGSTGQANLTSVRPGTYNVYAWENAERGGQATREFLKAFESRAKTVTVGESERATVEVTAIPASETGITPPPPPPPAAKGSFAGKVLNAVTGAPIGGVEITVRNMSGQEPVASITTDEQGRFAFPDLTPGNYTLASRQPRFVAAGAGLAANASAQVIVGEGQQIAAYVLKLVPAGVIAGTVTDEFGEPMMAARVQVYRYQSVFVPAVPRRLAVAGFAQTDDLGKYRIANLPPGDYYVNATRAAPVRGPAAARMGNFVTDPVTTFTPPPNFPASTVDSITEPLPAGPETAYVPVWYPFGAQPSAASAVRLAAGATAGNIDMTLRKSRVVRIRGRVVDSAGNPAGMPSITLTPKNSPLLASNVGNTTVGRDGSFEISGVPPGSYRLIARPMMAAFGGSMPPSPRMAVQSLDVTESSIEGIKLELSAGRTVTGSVSVEGGGPVPQSVYLSVTALEALEGGGGAGANVGAGGGFTIANVFPLTYAVYFQNLPANYYVKSIRYGGQEVSGRGFELTGEGDLEVVLGNTAAVIEGSVTGADGQPAGNAGIVVAPSSGSTPARTGNADARGNFYFANLPPGEYHVLAFDAEAPEASDPPESLALFTSAAKTVKLAENARERAQVTVVPAGR